MPLPTKVTFVRCERDQATHFQPGTYMDSDSYIPVRKLLSEQPALAFWRIETDTGEPDHGIVKS